MQECFGGSGGRTLTDACQAEEGIPRMETELRKRAIPGGNERTN